MSRTRRQKIIFSSGAFSVVCFFSNHFHFLGIEFKTPLFVAQSERENVILHFSNIAYLLELINFEILAAERLRLMGFDDRLIIDCFCKRSKYLYGYFLQMLVSEVRNMNPIT